MSETQTAVVTGGSTGIGRAICERLLADGYQVVSLARRPSPIEHERMHSITVDLMDREETRAAAVEVAERFEVTALIHNAGVIRPALVDTVDLADLTALTELHLGAAISLLQATLPTMRRRGYGRVVLLSSRAAQGLESRTSYSATKAGMVGMARTWALELAPSGITVNVVAPGPVQTDMFHEVVPADSPKVAELAARLPVRRLGQAEDVAHAVRFFVAPESGFVTGQVLYVCGGTSLGGLTL